MAGDGSYQRPVSFVDDQTDVPVSAANLHAMQDGVFGQIVDTTADELFDELVPLVTRQDIASRMKRVESYVAAEYFVSQGSTDGAAIQAAIDAVAARPLNLGGTVLLSGRVWAVNRELTCPAGVSLAGEGSASTLLNWATDLGAGKFAVKRSGTSGTARSRGFGGLALRGPSAYATFAPGTSPTAMDGLMTMAYDRGVDLDVRGFRRGVNVAEHHETLQDITCTNNDYGLWWGNEGSGNTGDHVLSGVVNLAGNRFAGIGVSAGRYLSGVWPGKIHLGFGPYGIWKEPVAAPEDITFNLTAGSVNFESCGTAYILSADLKSRLRNLTMVPFCFDLGQLPGLGAAFGIPGTGLADYPLAVGAIDNVQFRAATDQAFHQPGKLGVLYANGDISRFEWDAAGAIDNTNRFATTTTASVTLPAATITVASTAGLDPWGGTVTVGSQTVKYSSIDGTHLYGCTGGTGTQASGTAVVRAKKALVTTTGALKGAGGSYRGTAFALRVAYDVRIGDAVSYISGGNLGRFAGSAKVMGVALSDTAGVFGVAVVQTRGLASVNSGAESIADGATLYTLADGSGAVSALASAAPGASRLGLAVGASSGGRVAVEIQIALPLPIPPVLPDVQYFVASGTYTKPAGATVVEIIAVGGGGGGGSGRRGAAGTLRGGGGGGGGGAWGYLKLLAANVGATAPIVVGTGGAGAAAVTTDDTNGNAGSGGNDSTFNTSTLDARGGGGGGGGTTAAGTAGTGGVSSQPGGAGGTGAGSTPSGSNAGPGGGGGGGQITAANAPSTGGSGRGSNITSLTGGAGGAVDSTPPTAPSVSIPPGSVGRGGGGGAASITTAAQAGAGALGGGGGGGGGASLNGFASGAGAAGADGYVLVISS